VRMASSEFGSALAVPIKRITCGQLTAELSSIIKSESYSARQADLALLVSKNSKLDIKRRKRADLVFIVTLKIYFQTEMQKNSFRARILKKPWYRSKPCVYLVEEVGE
jgi:hypothetical protein